MAVSKAETVKGWPKLHSGPSFTAYMASKAALNMVMLAWVRSVAAADECKVWCISPGLLATDLGGNPELLKRMGAEDPRLGAEFIRDVVEGKRGSDVGKVVRRGGVQPW